MAKVIINEAEREIETERETALRRKLINFLATGILTDKKTGKTIYKCPPHPKYAKRLKDFIIKIVDRKEDPNMTAAINWDLVTIYVSDGFLIHEETFFQLNVILRHELAHNLMCHQLRMMHKLKEKYGEEGYKHFSMSQSLHHLLNVIEDYEISNERYTAEDKKIMRNLVLNGRIIKALVTEFDRQDWANMTLEQMYNELSKEIDELQQSILARWDILDMNDIGKRGDNIHNNIKFYLHCYTDYKHPTNFFGTLEQFINNRALYHFVPYDDIDFSTGQILRPCIAKFSSLPDVYQDILVAIDKEYTSANGFTKQELRDLVVEIAKSNPTVAYNLINPKLGHIVTQL